MNPENQANRPDDINPNATAGSEYPKGLSHSGVFGEKPIIEYPEPLSEALSENYIHPIPDTPELFTDGKLKEKKSKKGLIAGVIGGLAVVGVGIGAVIGISGDKDNKNLPPSPEPTVAAPTTPGTIEPTEAPTSVSTPSPSDIPTSSFEPTPTEVNTLDTFTPFEPGMEQELDPSKLEIKSGLEGDELAQAIVNRFNAWNMAGAVEQTFTDRDRSIDVEEYADNIADGNAKVFSEALFADPNDPEAIEAIEHSKDANAGALNAYIRTFDSSLNPENKEAYWTQSELDGEAEYSRHQDVIQIMIPKIAYDNSDKNIVEESKVTTGYKAVTILNLVDDGKTLKIQSIANRPR